MCMDSFILPFKQSVQGTSLKETEYLQVRGILTQEKNIFFWWANNCKQTTVIGISKLR